MAVTPKPPHRCVPEDEVAYRAVTQTGWAVCCKRCGASRPADQREVERLSSTTRQEA